MMNLTNVTVSALFIAQFAFLNRAERFHVIPQVDFGFLPWPPGFPAVPQYSNPVSVSPGTLQGRPAISHLLTK